MKLLVDTCVWSLSLRRRDAARLDPAEEKIRAALKETIRDRRIVMIGPIRQEILSGIRDRGQFAKVQDLLDPFRDEEIAPEDYIQAARMFNVCQDHGVRCGPVDMLLCAVAARLQCGILTCDRSLQRCADVLKGAGLIP